MNMSTCNPASTMEGHSNPTTPHGISTPCGGGSPLIRFAIDSYHHPLTLEQNRKVMDALHGYQKSSVICEFSQNTMLLLHPAMLASSSISSPLPFSLFNKCELMVTSECHWDTNQKMKEKNDTNIANDTIIKGQYWTPEEDRVLVEMVNQFGPTKWSQIARSLQGRNGKGRNGKQCRERWNNHLRPNIRMGTWSLEEDMILIKGHQEFGNKWSKIAKKLSGRTENAVKNHWNATKRRQSCKKNNHGHYKGSMLHAYVKWVTASSEESAKKVPKKSSDKKKKKKVEGCNCDELAIFLS
ncbi:hypothetical protein VNO80_14032 [Phaseolus coccineus]|uniref:Uncharacterized protein n=1 Tax=Phaseolus coccineus TaxID=3886 RepID=A0AAN9N2M0_PHACN